MSEQNYFFSFLKIDDHVIIFGRATDSWMTAAAAAADDDDDVGDNHAKMLACRRVCLLRADHKFVCYTSDRNVRL